MNTSGRRPVASWILWAFAGVVVVNLFLSLLASLHETPSGAPSSSYATTPEGVAAYAELLEADGRDVTRLRSNPSRARLGPGTTIVLLDPPALREQDVAALRRSVAAGATLVVGGGRTRTWLGDLLDEPPVWSARGAPEAIPSDPNATLPEVEGVREVAAAGHGAWADTGGGTSALSGRAGHLLLVVPVEEGRVVLLADTSPLTNRFLAEADNAQLGLSLASEGRAVAFIESVHGYTEARGLGALPPRWRWAGAILVLAVLLWMWSRGHRLGPPEETDSPPSPARDAYVHAVANTLARTRRTTEAAAPLVEAVRDLLHERAGSSEPDAIERAGHSLGLDDSELAAVLGGPQNESEAIAAGKALVRLIRGEELR